MIESRGISKFLTSYREFCRFNIQSPKEASLYLLGEIHTDSFCLNTQAELIHFLASQGPVIILFERLPAGEILSHSRKKAFFENRRLNLKDDISVAGWDVSDRLINSIGTSPLYLEEIVKNVLHGENQSIKLFTAINKIAPGVLKNRLEADNIDVEIFLNSEFQVCRQVTEWIETLGKTNDFISYWMKKFVLAKKNPFRPAQCTKTFPLRTAAMVSTLQQLDSIKRRLNVTEAKVVLIAGSFHLKTDREDFHDHHYDITPLYKELLNHKSIIYIPTHIWD